MLTLRQFIALESGTFVGALHANQLLKKFGVKSLAFRDVIDVYQKQTVAYCVELRSASLAAGVTSISGLQQRWLSGAGLLQAADFQTLQQNLFGPNGITLKLVTSDLKKATIIGSRASMANVPAINLNNLHPEDVASGIAIVATGAAGLGAVLMTIAAVPEPASPILFGIGIVIATAASTVGIEAGIMEIQDSAPKPSGTSSDNTPVPQPDGSDPVNVPSGEVYGDPPDGVDSAALATTILSDLGALPDGWDLNTGTGLPGIPGLGNGGSDDGSGGLGGIPGSGLV